MPCPRNAMGQKGLNHPENNLTVNISKNTTQHKEGCYEIMATCSIGC